MSTGPIQRAALHALGHALDKGERHEAFLALRQLDPIVRWRARSALLDAFRFADLSTAINDEAHRMRLAALRIARQIPEEGYEDDAAVKRDFERLRAASPAPRRGPWLSASLLAALGLVGGAFAGFKHWTAPFDPTAAKLGNLLGPELTEFIVLGSRTAPGQHDPLRERLLQDNSAALTAESSRALDRTLRALSRVWEANATQTEVTPELLNEATNGAVAFDDTLAKQNAPYFVDLDWLQRGPTTTPFLFSFYVEREHLVRAGEQTIRSVHLWRLDNLAVQQGYLGYTRPHTPAALVLLDQIEADLIGDVLPALPGDETMDLVDFNTRRKGLPWIAAVESSTAGAVRRHFAALPATEQARYQRVGQLLAQRRQLIRKWQDTLSELGSSLVVPVRLIPEADYLGELELRVPREQLRQWEEIHGALLSSEIHDAFRALRDNYSAAVERHEVQHRIDYRRELFEVPPVLVRRLNVENPLAAEPGSLPGRARSEFSAYLATLACVEPTPLLDLALLARFLFNRDNYAGAYTYSALAVYEVLAEQLGVVAEVRALRTLDRAHLAELVNSVLAQEATALRDAARAAYQAQFGDPVLQVTLESERINPAWRH